MRQHRSLGTSRGARGVAIDSDIYLPLRIDCGVEPRVIHRSFGSFQDRRQRREPRLVIVPEPTIVDVEDRPQLRGVARHRQHLVDLLLILPYQHHRAGMSQQKPQLIDRGVRIGAHHARTDAERGDLQHELLFAILGDEGDDLATIQASGCKPGRVLPHPPVYLAPGQRPPHTGALATDRGAGAAVVRPARATIAAGCGRADTGIIDRHGAQHPHQPTPR